MTPGSFPWQDYSSSCNLEDDVTTGHVDDSESGSDSETDEGSGESDSDSNSDSESESILGDYGDMEGCSDVDMDVPYGYKF